MIITVPYTHTHTHAHTHSIGLVSVYYHVGMHYLQNYIFTESDISRDCEVIKLQHVRDIIKTLQEISYLQRGREGEKEMEREGDGKGREREGWL